MEVENPFKIDKNSVQMAMENKMQVEMDLGSLLGVDFGAILGAKLMPSCYQNQKKGVPRGCQNEFCQVGAGSKALGSDLESQ